MSFHATLVLFALTFLAACSLDRSVGDTALVSEQGSAPTSEIVHLAIEVDDYNLRGRPFDGMGHVGGLIGPGLLGVTLQSPPDIYLCIVRLDPAPQTECNLGVDDKGRPLAPFHDARRADFAFEIEAGTPVGVLLLDQDDIGEGKLDDNIEAFVIASPLESPERVSMLDQALTQLLKERASTTMELDVLGNTFRIDLDTSEERRRLRGQDVIERGACDFDHPCRLDQSTVTISLEPV